MKFIDSDFGKTRQRCAARGFSMIEMVVVLAIIMVMLGITFISLQPALKEAHATNAYDSVLMQIRNARAKAVKTGSNTSFVSGRPRPPVPRLHWARLPRKACRYFSGRPAPRCRRPFKSPKWICPPIFNSKLWLAFPQRRRMVSAPARLPSISIRT